MPSHPPGCPLHTKPRSTDRYLAPLLLTSACSRRIQGVSFLPFTYATVCPGSWVGGAGSGGRDGCPGANRSGLVRPLQRAGTGNSEQVRPLEFAVLAFGQVQGEVAGRCGGDADQVAAQGSLADILSGPEHSDTGQLAALADRDGLDIDLTSIPRLAAAHRLNVASRGME